MSSEETATTEDFNSFKNKERKFKDLKPKLIYNVILVGVLFSFGILGGLVFKKFEAASLGIEENDSTSLPSARDFIQDLLSEKNGGNGAANEENWKNMAAEKLDHFISAKAEAVQVQEPVQWGFADSWLFACTIFTTIGNVICLFFPIFTHI